MAFTVPSREDLHDEFIADYAASQPNKSVAKLSTPWVIARAVSGLAWSIVAKLLSFDKQRLPDTATGGDLDRHGNVYSFKRNGAAPSSGVAALRVTGTVGAAVTPVPANADLTHADGTQYTITTVGAVIGGGGYVDVDVTAVSKGEATNKITGEVLSFSSPAANITATATLVKDLTKGLDTEDQEAYRARLLAHLGDPPEGGAIHDYVEWILKVAGNATAYVWKNRRGTGTIDVAALGAGEGDDRVIVSTTETQDYLDDPTRRPGNVKDVLVLTTTPQTQDVEMQISQDATIYKWDWDDAGTAYPVTAENSGTMTITVPTAPTAVVAGVRITVRGEEAKVQSRSGGDLVIALTSGNPWFAATAVGANMYASGDLVVPVQNAIRALFARLGPARDARYAQTEWESALQTDSLTTSARNVRGCTKSVLITPNADVVPVDSLSGSTNLPFLVPGVITVRKKP